MDKLKHFLLCLVGFEKERRDRANGGPFGWGDIAADAAGTLVGILLVLTLFAPAPAQAMEWPKLDQVAMDAAFAPPHNEPVIGDLVARYRLRTVMHAHWQRLSFLGEVNLWGCQKWRTPDQVGHGIPDAWEGSDWSVQEVRWDANYEVAFTLAQHVDLFTEYKWTQEYKGHDSYYWLTGFRLRLY
jgi:hypothetical protein